MLIEVKALIAKLETAEAQLAEATAVLDTAGTAMRQGAEEIHKLLAIIEAQQRHIERLSGHASPDDLANLRKRLLAAPPEKRANSRRCFMAARKASPEQIEDERKFLEGAP